MSLDLLLKDNIPFRVGTVAAHGQVFQVRLGIINLYHMRREENGEAYGKRTFLFQLGEGDYLFPIADTDSACLVGVPMRESELAEAHADFSAEWMAKACERLRYPRTKSEGLLENLSAETFSAFNASLMADFDKIIREEDAGTELRNRRRYKNEDVFFQSSLESLSHITDKSVPKKPVISDIPLVKACAAVTASQKMELVLNESIRSGKFSGDPVGDIASASHFRIREVMLTDNWYRESGGSILAWLEKDGEKIPVALLQNGGKGYAMYNPVTEETTEITGNSSENISPNGIMFYRSLPMKSLTGKDVISFAMAGTVSSDWIYVVVLGIAGGLLSMLMPQITGKVFDTVIPDGNRAMLLQIGFLMAAVALTNFAFVLTRSFAMQRISGAMEKDLQSAVWDRLLSLPATFFRDYSAGELAEHIIRDCGKE